MFEQFLTKAALLLGLLLIVSTYPAQIFYVVNSQSRTLSRIDLESNTVNNSFASLGNVPNKIVLDGDYIWCVNSGDNAVQKISRSTGQSLSNLFVGMGSNPWDAVKHEDYLYVTGLISGKVYKISTITGAAVGNLTVGPAPEALHIVGNKLYVTNAGNYSNNYAGSSVSVIDLDSFSLVTTIPVSLNPQYLASYEGKLHVSCTGNWTSVGGAICIIDTETDQLEQTVALGGTPGSILIATDEVAYVADSNGLNLYSYDPQALSVIHGSQNPISNGGSEIVGSSSVIAVLSPNWSGNGSLKIFDQNLVLQSQYSVAMMPTDLKMWTNPSANEDLIISGARIQVYPNPVRMGSSMHFEADKPLQAELQIYNLRGQLLSSSSFEGKSSLVISHDLASGIYLYKVREGALVLNSGRFVISR
jgi:hypothetical protein